MFSRCRRDRARRRGVRLRPRPSAFAGVVIALAIAGPAASTASASITINDAPAVTEGAADVTATFTVTRTVPPGTLASASVGYSSASGTAQASADYVHVSGMVQFASAPLGGTETKTINVTVKADALDELDEETFVINLINFNGDAPATAADTQGVGTIRDDADAPPSVSVAAASASESGTISFAITLSAPSGRTTAVNYATADGTATAPQDFAGSGVTALSFAAGETTKNVGVGLVNDTTDEPDETFSMSLSAPSNLTLGTASATGTIVDDDVPPGGGGGGGGTGTGTGTPDQGSGTTDPGSGTPPAGSGQPAASTTPAPKPKPIKPSGPDLRARVVLTQPSFARTGVLRFKVSCPREESRCNGGLTLFNVPKKGSKIAELRRETKLGRGAYRLRRGASTRIAITLPRRMRELLRAEGTLRMRAFAVTRDGAGNVGTDTIRFRLKRTKR